MINSRLDSNNKHQNNILRVLEQSIFKPLISVMGYFDSGKSTLINRMIESEILPTELGPFTSAPIYLRHVSDKPSWMKDYVYVYKNSDIKFWQGLEYEDRTSLNEALIVSGDYNLIKEYGARNEEIEYDEIGSVLVFFDAPILKQCTLVDMPGTGSGDRQLDSEYTLNLSEHIDGLIYLSPANGFLKGVEMDAFMNLQDALLDTAEYFKFNNLFIVASFADAVDMMNERKLNKILNHTCKLTQKGFKELYDESIEFEELRTLFHYHSIYQEGPVTDSNLYRHIWAFTELYKEGVLKEFSSVAKFLSDEKQSFLKGEIRRFEDVKYSFHDKVVEREIRKRLDMDGDILKSDLEHIESFEYKGVEQGRIKSLGDFAHMHALKKLTLPENDCTDLQPLSKLKHLEALDLSNCECLRVLDGIESIQSLKYLNLKHNIIENALPVLQLKNLEQLDLSHNDIKYFGSGQSAKNLKKLTIDNNPIYMYQLRDYESLKTLEIDYKRPLDIEPSTYFKLENRNFKYNGIEFKDKNLLKLLLKCFYYKPDILLHEDAKKFVKFSIDNTQKKVQYELNDGSRGIFDIVDTGIKSLEGIQNLTSLVELELIDVGLETVEPLSGLSELRRLSLSNNLISNINSINSINGLSYLDIDNNKINSVDGIGALINLKDLSIRNNRIRNVDSIANLKMLRRLMIKGNYYHDNSRLNVLLSNLQEKDFQIINEVEFRKISGRHCDWDEYSEELQQDIIAYHHNGISQSNLQKYLKAGIDSRYLIMGEGSNYDKFVGYMKDHSHYDLITISKKHLAVDYALFNNSCLITAHTVSTFAEAFVEAKSILISSINIYDIHTSSTSIYLGRSMRVDIGAFSGIYRKRFVALFIELIDLLKNKS